MKLWYDVTSTKTHSGGLQKRFSHKLNFSQLFRLISTLLSLQRLEQLLCSNLYRNGVFIKDLSELGI